MIRCFQVPLHDEMPSEEMIAWLHEMEPNQEWEGDESGITIFDPNPANMDPKMAEPGDYIVSYSGTYLIVYKKQVEEDPDLLKNLGVERIEK